MRKFVGVVGVMALAAGVSSARGSVLTFDVNPSASLEILNQDYGDRITAGTMGNFTYGTGGGFTPNVVVSYGPVPPAVPTVDKFIGYGSLVNVLLNNVHTYPTNVMVVTLTADPGFAVGLTRFEMSALNTAFLSDPTITYVRVTDGDGNVLFNQNSVSISRTGLTAFDFGGGLFAQELKISFDSGNLGENGCDIAMDNIAFKQVVGGNVPEPASVGVLGLGVIGLLARRRRV